ncbi:MAG TPA: hypothetical protein VN229_09530 [Terriglobales bacterium]|nr:hypothetical protein [Terriglobales bacterium]
MPVASEAATPTPKRVEYRAELDHAGTVMQCAMSLAFENDPESLEMGNFRIFVVEGAKGASPTTGYSLQIGQMKIEDSLPAGMTRTSLAKVAFISPSYNTAGEMQTTEMPDGGLGQVTLNDQSPLDLIGAFEMGNYDLSFVTREGTEQRRYHIDKGPSVDVMQKFMNCVRVLKR